MDIKKVKFFPSMKAKDNWIREQLNNEFADFEGILFGNIEDWVDEHNNQMYLMVADMDINVAAVAEKLGYEIDISELTKWCRQVERELYSLQMYMNQQEDFNLNMQFWVGGQYNGKTN